MTDTKKEVAKREPNITDLVLSKVNDYQRTGGLRLPPDYSPENALKSAYLVLQEAKDKNGKPVLEACTKVSIANALFDMVVRGLNPIKKQAYFIAYGNKLTLMASYFGNIATAKRVGLKNINAMVIYEGDKFEYSIDPITGRQHVVKHEQLMENIDINKIRGAYAVVEYSDGTFNTTIMTVKEIKQSWMQGATKGESGAHKNFSEELSKRTVINRACKQIINSSDDGYLGEAVAREEAEGAEVPANQGFVDFEDVSSEPQPTEPKPEVMKANPLESQGQDANAEPKLGPGF